jgi:hypothetical protein
MNIIQLNKFSGLHDGKKFFFCKTDYILDDLTRISKLKNEVVLVSANSDIGITDELASIAPKNIVRWYAHNAISNHDIIEPIPMGIENELESERPGHGIGYHASTNEKLYILTNIDKNKMPDRFIYANFNIYTNYRERIGFKEAAQECDHIDWEDPGLLSINYYTNLIKYKMVLCPVGNGIDTIRLWETLYCNRVPITLKVGDFKIYRLYDQLPIIVLNDMSQLYDKNYIQEQYDKIQSRNYDLSLLDTNTWRMKMYMSICVI